MSCNCGHSNSSCFDSGCGSSCRSHCSCSSKQVVCQGPRGPQGPPGKFSPVYGQVFHTIFESIGPQQDIKFSNNGIISEGITHIAGTAPIVILESGDYAVDYTIMVRQFGASNEQAAWGVTVNNSIVASTRSGGRLFDTPNTGDNDVIDHIISGSAIIRIPNAGSLVTLRNIGITADVIVVGEDFVDLNSASLRLIKLN